jgi:dolichol-phosphate mannosyltransferase
VAEIHQHLPTAEVLVIDDNSPDGTGRVADDLSARDPRVQVLHRPCKEGLGVATVAGFRWGLERGYDVIINMDADFSHPTRILPALLATSAECDVAVASRYAPGGGVGGWSFGRHLMSRLINAYARLLLRLTTHDNSGSYRAYRASILRRIPLASIRAKGYAIQEEMLYHVRRAGGRCIEVPFHFEERRHGQSKISWREAVGVTWVIFRLACCGPGVAKPQPDAAD